MSQQTVAVIEAGRLDEVTIRSLRAVARALGIDLVLSPRWKGGEADRLLDREHAGLVELVSGTLRQQMWTTLAEYSFSHYGERGSVDVVGWRPDRGVMVVVEVKTRIYDLQELLRSLDRKARVVPSLLAQERGWRTHEVGRLVVLPRTTANRAVLIRHAETFASALPAGTITVRAWLRDPVGAIAGTWFVASTSRTGSTPQVVGRQRVRLRSERSRPGGDGMPTA